MAENHLKPFLCEAIEKSVLRIEWEKWFRAFTIYLEAEQIVSPKTKKTKLLHLGDVQLQTVAFSLPGALIDHDEEQKNDVFAILVEKLDAFFSPKQNSTFERHLFRNLTPETMITFLNLSYVCDKRCTSVRLANPKQRLKKFV